MPCNGIKYTAQRSFPIKLAWIAQQCIRQGSYERTDKLRIRAGGCILLRFAGKISGNAGFQRLFERHGLRLDLAGTRCGRTAAVIKPQTCIRGKRFEDKEQRTLCLLRTIEDISLHPVAIPGPHAGAEHSIGAVCCRNDKGGFPVFRQRKPGKGIQRHFTAADLGFGLCIGKRCAAFDVVRQGI